MLNNSSQVKESGVENITKDWIDASFHCESIRHQLIGKYDSCGSWVYAKYQ